MRILGIDDNEDINALFDIALSSLGHEFSSTLSGRHGLTLIRENQYDCILLDLAMPEFSGMDLLNALEQEGLLSRQKVIIVTASSIVDSDFVEFKKRGVSECLRKPIDLDTLLQKIDAIAVGR